MWLFHVSFSPPPFRFSKFLFELCWEEKQLYDHGSYIDHAYHIGTNNLFSVEEVVEVLGWISSLIFHYKKQIKGERTGKGDQKARKRKGREGESSNFL